MKPNKRQQKADDDDGIVQWLTARSGWFFGMAGGLVIVFHAAVIASLFVGGFALAYSRYSLIQQDHYQSGRLSSSPFSHVLFGTSLLTLTLPNDLSAYVGRMYHVDCGSAPAHTIVIEPGSAASWLNNGARTATCLLQGGGFSFRVISSTGIRLVDPRNVSFT